MPDWRALVREWISVDHLEPGSRIDIVEELAQLCMVTHDPRCAQRADRGIHLFDGRVVEDEACAIAEDTGRPPVALTT